MQVVDVHRLADDLVPQHALLFDGHLVWVVDKTVIAEYEGTRIGVGDREHSLVGTRRDAP